MGRVFSLLHNLESTGLVSSVHLKNIFTFFHILQAKRKSQIPPAYKGRELYKSATH